MSFPYLDLNGDLVIPTDAAPKYRWWQAAKGGKYGASAPDNQSDVELVEQSFEAARKAAGGNT